MNDLLLVGAGGFCKTVIDVLHDSKEFNVKAIFDLKPEANAELWGIPILPESQLEEFKGKASHIFMTIGATVPAARKQKMVSEFEAMGFVFANIISSSAFISPRAKMSGTGNFIGHNVFVGGDTTIGSQNTLYTGTTLEHDCTVGDFCYFSPNTCVNGGVQISDFTFVGANATLAPYIEISEHVTIGSNSFVKDNLNSEGVYFGSPAKKQK